MLISDPDSLLNALLAGANTVTARMESSSPVSPAALTSAANEVSSGLWAAAVTTGSVLMPWKLPMPAAGTIPHSGPNAAGSAMACEGEVTGCEAAAPPDAAGGGEDAAELPHAAAASMSTAAATPAAAVPARPDLSWASVGMSFLLGSPGVVGSPGLPAAARIPVRPVTPHSAPGRGVIGAIHQDAAGPATNGQYGRKRTGPCAAAAWRATRERARRGPGGAAGAGGQGGPGRLRGGLRPARGAGVRHGPRRAA